MIGFSKGLFAFTAILISACASTTPQQTFTNAHGEWSWTLKGTGKTYKGKIVIVDESEAAYTHPGSNGKVLFYSIGDQKDWEGYWVDSTGLYKCAEKKGGSYYWGIAKMQFNDSYTTFKGVQNRGCQDDGLWIPWEGKRS